jgi:DNA-binding NtrC family response regulator
MKPIILIAEGDNDLRDRLGRLLGEHGYQVISASDGLECSRQSGQQKPQAVVLDQDLRWGGSEGALAFMRDDPALCRIPVILTFQPITSLSFSDLATLPVVRSLGKPYPFTLLLDNVRAAVAESLPFLRKARAGQPGGIDP